MVDGLQNSIKQLNELYKSVQAAQGNNAKEESIIKKVSDTYVYMCFMYNKNNLTD